MKILTFLNRRRHTNMKDFEKAVFAKPEVRPQHAERHSPSVTNDSKDLRRKEEPRHRHHLRHDHSSAEAEATCGRCIRKQQRQQDRERGVTLVRPQRSSFLQARRTEPIERFSRTERPPPQNLQRPDPISRVEAWATEQSHLWAKPPKRERKKHKEPKPQKQILGFDIGEEPQEV